MSPGRAARWKDEALRELIRRARAGERWDEIGAYFYGDSRRGLKAASTAFGRYASDDDKADRRRALSAHPRANANRGMPGGQASVEPAMRREKTDIFAGMGSCFG